MVENFTATIQQNPQQLPAEEPAIAAGANGGVDALVVVGLVIGAHQTLGVEGAISEYIVFSKVVLGDQPVYKIHVCIQHVFDQLAIHLISGLFHKLAVQLFSRVRDAVLLMPDGPLGTEHMGVPCGAANLLVLFQNHHLFAAVGGTAGGSETGSACADYQHITLPDKLFVRLCLGCWKIRIGDHIVVTDGGAVAAVDAFFRVDPVLCTLEANGTHGTFYPAAVAAGTVLPINDICHIRFSFLVSYLHNYSNAKGGTAQISIIMLWYDLWEYIIGKSTAEHILRCFLM